MTVFRADRNVRIGAALVIAVVTCGVAFASAAAAPGHRTLTAFASEAELRAYFAKLKARRPPMPPAPPPPAMEAAPSTTAGVPAQDRAAAAPGGGITNNQEAGVDEGDIVKLRGNTLIILRRGRLFTVDIARSGMRPVDHINAYPPGVNAGSDWYDEMLIAGDTVVIIGYSYGRGGTEINRFHLSGDGHLSFLDAHQLRSNDYYSSRNYASRLIGHTLILYTPRYLPYGGDAMEALPALRKWNGSTSRFERIGSAREVYRSPGLPEEAIAAVHTVVSCDVTAPDMPCTATSVFGPDGRDFYVAAHAVYVWLTPYWTDDVRGHRAPSMLYRLPLDGGAPSAIGVRGAPTDQFSFREDRDALSVLVRAYSKGDAMWASDYSDGAVALLRVPLDAFGDGMNEAPRWAYRGLPTPRGGDFHNRFVGDYVLYGAGNGWGTPRDVEAHLIVAPVHGGPVTSLLLPHGVDRIEVMGRDAVVVGSDSNNLYFSAISLAPGRAPALADGYTLAGAAQAETRSHGFFFRQDGMDRDGAPEGVLGLPVARPATPGYRQLFDTSAGIVFLHRGDGFAPLGELDAHDAGAADDACVASCVDWYGNARPIFVGRRIFALMGYELVEGELRGDTIHDAARTNFAPVRVSNRETE